MLDTIIERLTHAIAQATPPAPGGQQVGPRPYHNPTTVRFAREFLEPAIADLEDVQRRIVAAGGPNRRLLALTVRDLQEARVDDQERIVALEQVRVDLVNTITDLRKQLAAVQPKKGKRR